jgi:predicted metalloendopeptidase
MRTCLALLVAAACSNHKEEPKPVPVPTPAPHPAPPAPPPKSALAQTGIVPEWIDKTADPCNDFFAYACGGFVATAQIPADRASWGAISMVQQDNEDFLRKVLDDAAGATADKLGAYYAACTNEDAIEKLGTAPIQSDLDAIGKVTDARSAAAAIIALQAEGFTPFFEIGPQQDFADATQMIAGLDQAGIGMPDRKYYLESGGRIPKVRDAYKAHVERVFGLLKDPRAKDAAANAYRIEEAIAKVEQDEVTRRDPHAIYHRVERAGLVGKVAPSFPWVDYLAAMNLGSVTAISVNDPAYFTAVAKLIASEKPDALRDYLTWTVLRQSSNFLGKAWVDEAFTMDKELRGVKELAPRWKRCVRRVDRDLGELLGQAYVAARFAGDSKSRASELAKDVLGSMTTELDGLAWMDAATRTAAKVKLAKMAYLVGYPDKWRAYDFAISRDHYADDVRAAQKWELARQLAKIGKPVDRKDWQMSPPTVNAYYDPSLNELVLPAGQLQAPFFGATFHPAVNFGDTGGGTIGHEMTHGFDDEGSQFDGDGNLRDWWSKSTKTQFGTAVKCIQDQYAGYEAVPGVHLDGKLTAGENIADNGGVKIAYGAYQAWREHASPAPAREVDGYSDDQLYYLGYGQSWCEKDTPESLETQARTNPHSPAKWRVNGVVANQPGFAEAFKCKAGTAMNPEKKCGVW